jgi:hypothetical protein
LLAQAVAYWTGLSETTERALGEEQPNAGAIASRTRDALASRSYFAAAYLAAGQPDNALRLYKRTVIDSERILGADHPDTLDSRNGLAPPRR